MQLLVILLIAVVLGRHGLAAGGTAPAGWAPWIAAWAPPIALAFVQELAVRRAVRRLGRGCGPAGIARLDRFLRLTPWLGLASVAFATIALDWPGAVVHAIGDRILLDELVSIAPGLVVPVAGWWSWHPVERRLREAAIVRRLDLGLAVHPTPSRWRYLVQQVRTHLLLLLVPIAFALGLSEASVVALDRLVPDRPWWADGAATIGSVGVVFLLAPLVMRVLLDVRPLPAGAIRDDLVAVCAAHRVRVADLLLWRTDGTMINAAVIGLVPSLRYVMLTDALLDAMRRDELRAVMAHEVGHVRLRHMAWLAVSLVAAVAGAALLVDGALLAIAPAAGERSAPVWIDSVALLAAAVAALAAFGFASRRFERQADAFAAAHLSRQSVVAGEPGVVTPSAVASMCGALDAVAELNHVDPERRSWRHGSIRWRQRGLVSLVDQPLERLSIDRHVRVMNACSVAIVVLVVVASYLQASG